MEELQKTQRHLYIGAAIIWIPTVFALIAGIALMTISSVLGAIIVAGVGIPNAVYFYYWWQVNRQKFEQVKLLIMYKNLLDRSNNAVIRPNERPTDSFLALFAITTGVAFSEEWQVIRELVAQQAAGTPHMDKLRQATNKLRFAQNFKSRAVKAATGLPNADYKR